VVLCVLVVVAVAKPKQKTQETSTRISTTEAYIEPEADSESTDDVSTDEVEETDEVEVQSETFAVEIEAALANMSAEEKVAQLLILSPEQLTGEDDVTVAGTVTRAAMEDYPVGGLVYTYGNVENEEQLTNLVNGSMEMGYELTGYNPLIMAELVADGESAGEDTDTSTDSYIIYADSSDTTPIIEIMDGLTQLLDGADSIEASDIESAIEGVASEGASDEGSTVGVALTSSGVSESLFEQAAPIIIWNEEINKEIYGSIPKLRQDYDYHGVVAAEAVDSGEKAVELLTAGADMLYMPENFENIYEYLVGAVQDGSLTEDEINRAVGRVLTIKAKIDGEELTFENGDVADATNQDNEENTAATTQAAETQAATTQAATTQAATTRRTTTQAATTQAATTQKATTQAATTQKATTTQAATTQATTTQAATTQEQGETTEQIDDAPIFIQ
jgi:beta-N-acetylhexosaminidase